MSNFKELLTESYNQVQKVAKIKTSTEAGQRRVLRDKNAYKIYRNALAEGLNSYDAKCFKYMADTVREQYIMNESSNSAFNIKTYETYAIPMLRYYFPKQVAKEMVTVIPIDKPEVMMVFVKPKFKKLIGDVSGASFSDYTYNYPSVSTDISQGPTVGYDVDAQAAIGETTNILAVIGIDDTMPAHVEKNFEIVGVLDDNDVETAVSIKPDVDGRIAATVIHDTGDVEDQIFGEIDYLNGTLTVTATGVTTAVVYKAVVSLEENSINPKTQVNLEKIEIRARDRRIEAVWTTNAEQDYKALYDFNLQAELIAINGSQISLDTDREIINDIVSLNSTRNPSSHTVNFYKVAPDSFMLGPKAWYENIIPKLNDLSATIFKSTNIAHPQILACNPSDAAILESINSFEYLGDAAGGGQFGYRTATVQGGKWKILTSPIVPEGKIINIYKGEERMSAVYLYCPYVPALLTPYPLQANPSMTLVSRYGKRHIRPEGFGVLQVVNDQE